MDISLLEHYFPELSGQQKEQLEQVSELYLDWNSKVNLVSRKDIDQLVTHHLLHSLGIAKYLSFKEGAHVLDLGTGGGFPAVPLAIFFPKTRFFAVDSIRKKIKVVEDVAQKAKLDNLSAHWMRVEEFKEAKLDFVVTRAVASSAKLMQWTRGKFSGKHNHSIKNGIIALKGGDLEEEIIDLKGNYHIQNFSEYFREDFFETKKILYVTMKR